MPGKKTARKPDVQRGRRLVEHDDWPPTIIVWVDANSHNGDYPLAEVLGDALPLRRSIGFVVAEDDEKIVLAGTDDRAKFSAVEHVADTLEIPHCLVRERVALKPIVTKRKGRRHVSQSR